MHFFWATKGVGSLDLYFVFFCFFANPVSEKPVSEKPVSEKPVSEKPVSENLYLKNLYLKNLSQGHKRNQETEEKVDKRK